ncbi:hypothetical protein PS712_03418 [Pseudomonas fluorescens]|uniref:Fibronectin type-III domain-containing protein n=1 Tax=Pseudomonas fluorescens TaxID=294 RepID=A0A5E7CZT3_PSEFL|nr:hypothetical protein [Pseudomonas fluorescens]VVO10537.1 hypothetical protein PS712_03418 [Pseudomonas fluorescens]
MKDDPADTTVDLPSPSLEPVEPRVNYSRWMTDMAADIAHLKLSQMAIPGAHNSGVDMAGTWGPEELWGANQVNSFPEQLAAGARHLDLRLYDSSYYTMVGNGNPTRYFHEVFEFKHGIASAGRRLEHLIRDVKNFVIANPGEIVILNFHQYNRGSYPHDSLERCLPYFNPIIDLLIPSSASDSTIGEIRQKHPGRSIVLFFDHGAPTYWQAYMWGSLSQKWNPNDSTDTGIEDLVIQTMKSPQLSGIWALSACVYSTTGPKNLDRNHPVRRETFRDGAQNCNIVMVDFIERFDTKLSVTDRCITLNKLRSRDRTGPSAPTDFIVRKMRNEDTTDGNYQNTILFNWTASTDNLGVYGYEIFRDDQHFAFTNETSHRVKDFPKLNTTFKVRSFDILRNYSAFSVPFTLIQDTVAPTLPKYSFVRRYGYAPPHTVVIAWDPSYDEAGVDGYELKINGQYSRFLKHSEGFLQVHQIEGLNPAEKYVFEIRAKDINGLYSEYIRLTRPIISYKLYNHRYTLRASEDGKCRAISNWDVTPEITDPENTVYCAFSDYRIKAFAPGEPIVDTSPLYWIDTKETLKTFFTSKSSAFEKSQPEFFDIIFDITPPQPVTNLQVTPKQESTTITWTRSSSPNIKNYALSLNEAPPIFLAASESSYELNRRIDDYSVIDVWSINDKGIPSILEGVPDNPPREFRVTNVADQNITFAWAPPIRHDDKVIEYKFAVIVVGVPLPVQVGLQNEVTIPDISPTQELKVRVWCSFAGGENSIWRELILPPRS